MKKINYFQTIRLRFATFIGTILLIGLTNSKLVAQTLADDPIFELVFVDDFASLDTSKWNHDWGDYGDVCTITTPATLSRLADTTFLQQALQPIFDQLENSENALSLSVFPNPNNFDEEFSIEIKGILESNQKIKLSILNMVGARVFRSDIITKEENSVLIKPEIRLASGVYIVEADLNGIKLRKKFVVQ
jgi:hypothetical protein